MFHSKAQLNKFFELHKAGKISLGTIAHYALNTPDIKNLPERKDQNDSTIPMKRLETNNI